MEGDVVIGRGPRLENGWSFRSLGFDSSAFLWKKFTTEDTESTERKTELATKKHRRHKKENQKCMMF